jgi:eukaryotic-like serine/threonine-protein kinase
MGNASRMPAVDRGVSLPSRYRLVGHIANGGMASVWGAEDELLHRLVAVKVLSEAYAAEPSAVGRFGREARAGARVGDHPNIVTVFDVGAHGGRPFMVMEHLAGGTLADRLRSREPVPTASALAWLREAASALDHAHARDVVHRDVKPANLLLDEHGRLAVGDFGIATVATETPLTLTGQVLGTAAYISPEQALGRPATAASDRYALAVVAYELLTGRRPFPAATVAEQARAHVEATVPAASAGGSGLPTAVDAVLARGMAKDPADRPPTAGAFVDELERALRGSDGTPAAGATAVTRPPAPDAPPGRPARGRAARAPAAPPGRPATGRVGRTPAGTATDRPRPTPPPRRRSRRPALLAVAALVLVAGAAVALAVGGPGPGGGQGQSGTGGGSASRSATTTARTRPRSQTTQSQAGTPRQPAPSGQSAPPGKAAAKRSASSDPVALNDQGFRLIGQGRPAEAAPILQRSVTAFRAGGRTGELDYAYALFNLGNALRLAGRPAEAIPYLEERLRISDFKRGEVQGELAAARQATGAPAGGEAEGKGKAKGKDKPKGGD